MNDAELVRWAAAALRRLPCDPSTDWMPDPNGRRKEADRLTALADRLDGGVIVPREPDLPMLRAGFDAAKQYAGEVNVDWDTADYIYRAMLTASEAK